MTDTRRLLAYTDWANTEVLFALRALAEPHLPAERLLAHLVATEELWRSRVTGDEPRLPVWPDLTLAQIADWLLKQPDAWATLLDAYPPDTTFGYTNSKGETFESTVADMTAHVVAHGGYHRGQIALLLRQAGEDPPYTDYIHAIRSGALEA